MRRARLPRITAFVAAASVVLGSCGSEESATVSTGASSVPPTAAAAVTTTVAPKPRMPRVLLIGDSTLLAVDRFNAQRALQGFEYSMDAKSCRTLGIVSCGPRPVPSNAVSAIQAAPGSFDDVVIMAGYDEWWTSFPKSFDKVVAAARAKGARHIIWLTYREGVGYKLLTGVPADESFVKNNQTLRDKVASGAYPDVVLAKWYPHAAADSGWLTDDGIHLTVDGALGVADYISRWVAFTEGLPCPMPTVPGGSIEAVCSNPDTQPQIADVRLLYKP